MKHDAGAKNVRRKRRSLSLLCSYKPSWPVRRGQQQPVDEYSSGVPLEKDRCWKIRAACCSACSIPTGRENLDSVVCAFFSRVIEEHERKRAFVWRTVITRETIVRTPLQGTRQGRNNWPKSLLFLANLPFDYAIYYIITLLQFN